MRRLVFMGIVSAVGLVAPQRAHAAAYDFSAGSWIIPMDVCYQPSQSFNGSSFSGTGVRPRRSTAQHAAPTASGTGQDGMFKAYGLVYRLLQNNVPVYYILEHDQDRASTTSTSTSPASARRRSRWSRTAAARRPTATPPSS